MPGAAARDDMGYFPPRVGVGFSPEVFLGQRGQERLGGDDGDGLHFGLLGKERQAV